MPRESRGPKVNGYSNAGRLKRQARKRAEAQERQARRDARSASEQLQELLLRPGVSSKEWSRLFAQTQAEREQG